MKRTLAVLVLGLMLTPTLSRAVSLSRLLAPEVQAPGPPATPAPGPPAPEAPAAVATEAGATP